MRATICFLICSLPGIATAHHGVASLGVAGLEGPGAPIETSSSATLPEAGCLAYIKLDLAEFEKMTAERDDEGDLNAFWIYGVGYGIRPWLSAYVFAPFYSKRTEDNSFVTSGFADPSLTVVLGFKYDEGLSFVPAGESLDELDDFHFTLYGGLTLPIGDANIEDRDGRIDPGMSLGFGRPSYALGSTLTKTLASRSTLSLDGSIIAFDEFEYEDGQKVRFGDELRLSTALAIRVISHAPSRFRWDAILEGNFLRLGRDESDGIGETATGGSMVYATPGLRFYLKSSNLGLGVKWPVWTDLNEEDQQQGAEGKEDYRLIITFSSLI